MSAQQNSVRTIFVEALEIDDLQQRAAFLAQACGADSALLREVEELIQAHATAGKFLPQQPAVTGVREALLSSAQALGPASAASIVPVSERPGDRIGHYKLLQQIGEGGCGIVYMAEQEESVRRRVALKVIKLGMDTKQVVARFEAERQALALMDHPNIARVFDAGATEAGRPYFVMELVRGTKITEYCDENQLSTRERLELFIQVCLAVQHAHQKGIIHRDLKPSNILVTVNDAKPVPKVIDFGIAKATEGRLTDHTLFTAFDQFLGTPAYMSPEQTVMTSQDIDTRSDLYSLGVLLYELLAGKTPFDAKELLAAGIDEMRRTIRETEPVRPSTRLSTMLGGELTNTARRRQADAPKLIRLVRGDLDWIVMKCLEKDRTRRYETANGIATDIKRHLNSQPVAARPPSTAYQVQKFVRRNKLMVVAAATVALVLVLGSVVCIWEAIRARQAAMVARRSLYASDMLLAQVAHSDGNLDLALQLLNKHRPQGAEPELRGWEWRYLWGVCRSDELSTFATNSGRVMHVAVSSDGKLLAATTHGPARRAVKLWQFPSGRLLSVPEASDAAGSVTFSQDGQLLAFGTKTHGTELWDIAASQEAAHFPGTYNYVYEYPPGPLFSPDGRTLATGAGKEILLWNLETRALNRALKVDFGGANCYAFSPNGETLATGSIEAKIRLWSVADGREIALLTNHTKLIQALAFAADGKTLVSAGWDKTIRIWDLSARRQVKVLTNHTRWVSSLAFSPDQKTLASASGDFTIRLWDTTHWEEVSTLRGNRDEVDAIAFSPDGKMLISGAKDGAIKTWNPVPTIRDLTVLNLPSDALWWRLSGGTLSCGHTNGTISYWNPSTFVQTARYDWPEEHRTNSLVSDLTSSGKLVWADKQGEIVVWDLPSRRQVFRLPWVSGEEKVVTVSLDGKLLAGAAAGKGLTIWDLGKLQEIATLPKSAAAVFALRFSRDSHLIAAGNWDGTVEVWDLGRRERVADWEAHQSAVTGLEFMPEGNRLVTVSYHATAKLCDTKTGREVIPFPRTLNAFRSVAVSPDGQRTAGGTTDGQIKMWISATGQEIASLRAGDEEILDLQFLGRDGNTLISVTSKRARLWRAPSWEEIAAVESKEKAQ